MRFLLITLLSLCMAGVLHGTVLKNFQLRGSQNWQLNAKAQALPETGFLLNAGGSAAQMLSAAPGTPCRFQAAVRAGEPGEINARFVVFDTSWKWLRETPARITVEGGNEWKIVETTSPALEFNPAAERLKFIITNTGKTPVELGALWLEPVREFPEGELRRVGLANTDFSEKWHLNKAGVNAESRSLSVSGAGGATLNVAVEAPAGAPCIFSCRARNASERPAVLVAGYTRYLRAGWKWQGPVSRSGAILLPSQEFQKLSLVLPAADYDPETEALKLTFSVYGTGEITAPELETTVPAETVLQRAERLRKMWIRKSDKFAFADIAAQERAELFSRYELAFDLEANYENPFDPDDIAVDAVVGRPDGRQMTLPCFFYADFSSKDGKTRLTSGCNYIATGQKGWKFRYTPTLPGRHTLKLRAVDRTGRKIESGEMTFEACPARGKGFVTIASRNPEFFENTGDGSLFWACGTNIPWTRFEDPGEPTYDYYFRRAAGKMNATRIWLCHYAWLEWLPAIARPSDNCWSQWQGLTVFNQMISGEVDRIFEMAEAQNLRIMLVTEDNDETFASGGECNWKFNPYNLENGGFVATPEELFEHPGAIRAYQKRLRYILARWGYSTSLWAINAWNDMHDTQPRHAAWIKTMRDYVHAVVDGSRPILYGANYSVGSEKSKDYFTTFLTRMPGMPNVEQECYFLADHFEETTLDSIYQGLCKQLAGVMVWGHVPTERRNCWDLYRAPAAFAESMRLNEKVWKTQRVEIRSAEGELRDGVRRIVTARAYGDVPVWGVRAQTNRFRIDFSDSSPGHLLRGLNLKVYGRRADRIAWRNPTIFEWDNVNGGEFVVNAGSYGAGDNLLTIAVDGKKAAETAYLNGRRELKGRDRFTTVSVPPGKHELTVDLENPESDWVSIHEFLFLLKVRTPAELLAVNALASTDSGFLYLVNSSYNVFNKLLEIPGEVPLRNVRLELPGMATGEYRVEAVDPRSGAVSSSSVEHCRDGVLSIQLPEVKSRMLVRWEKASK